MKPRAFRDDILDENRNEGVFMKYCIFGAGDMGMKLYARFCEKYDIVCFCDNSPEKQGGKYIGLPVIAPEELERQDLNVIIACKSHFEIARQLFLLGIKEFHLLRPDTMNDVTYIDLSPYDDLTLNSKRICVIETYGTGGSARALMKFNPYSDLDIVQVELGIYDTFDVFKKGCLYYAYFTSALFISQNSVYIHEKKCIELWHGFPIKALDRVSNDQLVQTNVEYISDLLNNKRVAVCSYSRLYNFFMGCCRDVIQSKFCITGMPRNDLLLLSDASANMRKLFGKISHTRIVLYAPTFREATGYGYSGMKEGYFFAWHDYCLNDFDSFLQEHGILLLAKIHAAEVTELNIEETKNIKLVTDEMLSNCDLLLYEILGAVDLLITDYSSIAVDYLLIDNPIVYTIRDVDEYSTKHGLMTEPFDAWAPGETVRDYKGLKAAISEALFGEDRYKGKREQMRRIMHKYNDAESTRRVLDLARDILNNDTVISS